MSDDKLVPYQPLQPVPMAEMLQMAAAFAKSGLFGVTTPEQALALMLVAQAEGLHPANAARDYDIIQGRPAKKSEAMLRSFIAAGGSVEWHELTDDKAEATFSHPSGGRIKLDWTMDRAKRAGLADKTGSMYKKYPRQMLRARVISEGVRTICPSATGGMYTPEEMGVGFETRPRRGRGGFSYAQVETPPQTALPPAPAPESQSVEDRVSQASTDAANERHAQQVSQPSSPITEASHAEGTGVGGGEQKESFAVRLLKRIEAAGDIGVIKQVEDWLPTQRDKLTSDEMETAQSLLATRKKALAPAGWL